MSVVVMEEQQQQQQQPPQQQNQPVFRDFLGPGPGPNSELKQPELSATDSVRVSQNSGFMDEDGEASVRGGSTFSAPPAAAAPPPASSDPAGDIWRHSKAGMSFGHASKAAEDSRKRDDSSGSRGAFRDSFMQDAAERPMKLSRLKQQRESDVLLPSTGNGDLCLSMQPPRASQVGGAAAANSPWLQTCVFKADATSGTSKRLESSRPVGNGGVPLPARSSQVGGFPRNTAPPPPPQSSTVQPGLQAPPADEGSRTGLQGGGIAALINNQAAKLPSSSSLPALDRSASLDRSKLPLQTTGSESLLPSHKPSTSITRQLTIFYGGQAHVFDDVSPDKADAIMALAGSNGRSWSTTYAHRTSRSEGSLNELEQQQRRRDKAGGSSNMSSLDVHNMLSQQQSNPQAQQVQAARNKYNRFSADHHQLPKAPVDIPPGGASRLGAAAAAAAAASRAAGLHTSFYNNVEAGSTAPRW